MALVVLIVVVVIAYYIAVNTGNTKKRLDVKRTMDTRTVCPHCGHLGVETRSPAIAIAKLLTLGLFALLAPGSRKCPNCGYKF